MNLSNKSIQTQRVVLPSLLLGPVRPVLPVLTEDLSFLEKAVGYKVDAIVGLDVLRKGSFTIDYRTKEMFFGPVENLAFSAPFETDPPIVTLLMEFQTRHLRVAIDTGGPDLMPIPKSNARLYRPPGARDRKGYRCEWNISTEEGADS